MKTVRRMVQGEVLRSVGFVTLAFLALFVFIDLVAELRWVDPANPEGYQVRHAVAYVATLSVSNLYDLIPITVLIGSVFVMARLAQSSEFTVLRTSGLSPGRALRIMLGLGLGFTLLTFAVGDFVAPVADRAGQFLRAKYSGEVTIGQTGAWLREKQNYSSYAVNVGVLDADGGMRRVRVIEFDNQGRLVSINEAKAGRFGADDAWLLYDVSRTEFPELPGDGGAGPALRLPALPHPWHFHLCVHRGHDGHQLLPAQRPVRIFRQLAKLVAVADVGGAGPAVLAAVPVCVWLAGAATINADRQAVVLFAHGSRDPLWSRPIEAIALRMAALQLATKGIMNMIISWHSI
jgi:hypothetical protein